MTETKSNIPEDPELPTEAAGKKPAKKKPAKKASAPKPDKPAKPAKRKTSRKAKMKPATAPTSTRTLLRPLKALEKDLQARLKQVQTNIKRLGKIAL